MNCCGDDYSKAFTKDEARSSARRFRRRGLGGTARLASEWTAAALAGTGSLLEVGGGAGLIGIHLLESGSVRSATNVELSESWEEVAVEIATERGVADSFVFRVGDFAVDAAALGPVDATVMHRVVCCYPDWKAMVDAAAAVTRHSIVITIPTERWWNRLAVGITNRYMRWRRLGFRAFVHAHAAILARLEAAGFSIERDAAGPIWRTVLAVRKGEGNPPTRLPH